MYACPKCGRTDKIDICADVWVRLIQPEEDPEAFETDADEAEGGNQGHEFDRNHGAICRACGEHGNVSKFETELDSICRTCSKAYADGGDGYDGECPECADKSAADEEDDEEEDEDHG